MEKELSKIAISDAKYEAGYKLVIRGYVLSHEKITEIKVFLNNKNIGQTHYGIPRYDVFEHFPQYKNANSGFIFHYYVDIFNSPTPDLEIRAYSNDRLLDSCKVPKSLIEKQEELICRKLSNLSNFFMNKDTLTYPKMSKHLIYRILTGGGTPLSDDDYEEIEKNDQLYITLMLLNHQGFLKYLCFKYSIPEFIIKYIFEMQFSFFKYNLQSAPETKRAMLFYQWMHRELGEIKRHNDLIRRLSSTFNLKKGNFFDVGSKFCTSMIIALTQGFKIAHGCDFEEKIFKYAKDIIELGKKNLPGELMFYPADFLKLELKENFYHLIILINVLEHTSNFEKTIYLVKKILDETGICFIFQGSYKSLSIVLNEPHYNLPLLSILKNELAVKILKNAKLIKSDQQYCVVKWPDYYDLLKICNKHDLILEIDLNEEGYYGIDKFIPYSQFETYKGRIINETKKKIYPLIDPADKTIIEKVLSDYFSEVEQAINEDSIGKKLIYFKRNWDIILKKAPLTNKNYT